ncbi:MAG: RIP metalloprotease RseP [Planctomycetes bacterium]|nr:RIP metalloprotease RseP [Planctomycetota bacterium]
MLPMDGPFEIARGLQVIFGIGLVIFVHELGHYLAARLCKVRVETFSLGFGPRLLGKRIGSTYYQLAAIPLGGYCRMAGEERRADGLPPEPDELPAKSVGQRFFIYSGGVLMNVLFGLVVFTILFQVGVPFTSPIVGQTIPGGPAWRAGVPEGQEIVAVNGTPILEFEHHYTEIALGDPQRATLLMRDPHSGLQHTYEITPKLDAREGLRTIEITPDFQRDAQGRILLDVKPNSAAARAGLATGDRLLEVLDGVPGLSALDQIALQARGDQPLSLRIEGADGVRDVRVAPELGTRLNPPRVGIAQVQNQVQALRASALAPPLGLREGDELLSVNEQPILGLGDLQRALLSSSAPVRMRVRRGEREEELRGPALDRAAALALADDVAIGGRESSTELVVQPGDAAERAGLRTGDQVLRIDGTEVRGWLEIKTLVERAGRGQRPAEFRVRRAGAPDHLTIAVQPEARAIADYGLSLQQAQYLYRSDNFCAAMLFGARYSWRFLEDSWLTLKRMLTQDVSPKNVGGIISISAVSYSLTEAGWSKFFFFLCLVSINLAFINILPFPVLDGGHLFFLIIEKLKGSPVSNRVLGTSQAIGVVLLLSLMVYVTYNDLVRWVFPPR